MLDSLKLAAICLTSTMDRRRNIEQATHFARQAALAGADWILLPEAFPYIGPYETLYEIAEEEGGLLCQVFSSLARELNVVIFAGSMQERPSPEEQRNENPQGKFKRVFNTSYIFGRSGEMLGKYRKTHLFGLRDSANAAIHNERDGYIPGDKPLALNVEGWRVGIGICYDLRFPEYFLYLGLEEPLDMIVLPSAFTKFTGQFHWLPFLQVRAVENQCYVFAANQTGNHYAHLESYGHSVIFDPWGTILCDSGDQPGIVHATATKAEIAKIRSRLPALADKRPDLYRA